jgi:hypothetical protein
MSRSGEGRAGAMSSGTERYLYNDREDIIPSRAEQ